MSQFSRRARWLNALFPASVAPTVTDPGQRSDDVSLVAQYDGGGWGFVDPRIACRRFTIPIGITDTVTALTTDVDSIFRILAMDVVKLAGANAEIFARITSGSGSSVVIAYHPLSTPDIAQPQPFAKQHVGTPIVLPGQTFAFDSLGGDIATHYTVGVYGVLAPLGTVFNV